MQEILNFESFLWLENSIKLQNMVLEGKNKLGTNQFTLGPWAKTTLVDKVQYSKLIIPVRKCSWSYRQYNGIIGCVHYRS